MGKKYCIECGNKVGWTGANCATCGNTICGKCNIYFINNYYCVICSLPKISERKNYLIKNLRCAKCGSKIKEIESIFCPFCGNNIREGKQPKLGINKKRKNETRIN